MEHIYRVVGARSVPVTELERSGGADIDAWKASILERFAADGFFDVVIDSLTMSVERGETTCYLSEGRQTMFCGIHAANVRALKESDLHSGSAWTKGMPFRPSDVENEIRRMLLLYEARGYAFASIDVDSIVFHAGANADSAEVFLRIDEGQEVRIANILVEGNKTTRTEVIRREARVAAGALFTGDMPARVKHRLDRMQLFSSVSLPELVLDERNAAALQVQVMEGSYNTFDGIVGYVPSSGLSGGGYVTGMIRLQFRNLLGTARRLNTRWHRENRSSQEIELQYFEPWVAALPVNASVGFFQRKQDSLYVATKFDAVAELMVSEELTVGGSFSGSSTTPTQGYGSGILPESRSTSIGLSLRYDTRDDPATPTAGAWYATEYQSGSKHSSALGAFLPEVRSATSRLTFDGATYVALVRRHVALIELHIRDFQSPRIDPGDLFRLGGATSLRGYREGQFLGNRLVWGTVEYRLLVGPRSFFYGFLDAGLAVFPDGIAGSNAAGSTVRKIGYGVGVRVDSGVGLIGVSLALGEGDTFGTAKLHFRLMNEF